MLDMDSKVEIFKALGNKTRFMMFKAIFTKSITCSIDKSKPYDEKEAESLCVTTLASQFDYSLPTISNHLKQLRKAGLVVMEKRGNKIYIEAQSGVVKELSECFADLANNLGA